MPGTWSGLYCGVTVPIGQVALAEVDDRHPDVLADDHRHLPRRGPCETRTTTVEPTGAAPRWAGVDDLAGSDRLVVGVLERGGEPDGLQELHRLTALQTGQVGYVDAGRPIADPQLDLLADLDATAGDGGPGRSRCRRVRPRCCRTRRRR